MGNIRPCREQKPEEQWSGGPGRTGRRSPTQYLKCQQVTSVVSTIPSTGPGVEAVIPDTLQAVAERSQVQGLPGKLSKTLSQNTNKRLEMHPMRGHLPT